MSAMGSNMSRRQGGGRSAIITAAVVGAVMVAALLVWIGFSIFTVPPDGVFAVLHAAGRPLVHSSVPIRVA